MCNSCTSFGKITTSYLKATWQYLAEDRKYTSESRTWLQRRRKCDDGFCLIFMKIDEIFNHAIVEQE